MFSTFFRPTAVDSADVRDDWIARKIIAISPEFKEKSQPWMDVIAVLEETRFVTTGDNVRRHAPSEQPSYKRLISRMRRHQNVEPSLAEGVRLLHDTNDFPDHLRAHMKEHGWRASKIANPKVSDRRRRTKAFRYSDNNSEPEPKFAASSKSRATWSGSSFTALGSLPGGSHKYKLTKEESDEDLDEKPDKKAQEDLDEEAGIREDLDEAWAYFNSLADQSAVSAIRAKRKWQKKINNLSKKLNIPCTLTDLGTPSFDDGEDDEEHIKDEVGIGDWKSLPDFKGKNGDSDEDSWKSKAKTEAHGAGPSSSLAFRRPPQLGNVTGLPPSRFRNFGRVGGSQMPRSSLTLESLSSDLDDDDDDVGTPNTPRNSKRKIQQSSFFGPGRLGDSDDSDLDDSPPLKKRMAAEIENTSPSSLTSSASDKSPSSPLTVPRAFPGTPTWSWAPTPTPTPKQDATRESPITLDSSDDDDNDSDQSPDAKLARKLQDEERLNPSLPASMITESPSKVKIEETDPDLAPEVEPRSYLGRMAFRLPNLYWRRGTPKPDRRH